MFRFIGLTSLGPIESVIPGQQGGRHQASKETEKLEHCTQPRQVSTKPFKVSTHSNIDIMSPNLKSQPPTSSSFILSYPAEHILLVTINRPSAMNSIPMPAHWEAESIFNWFDYEPTLRVAIITGAGKKAFCAGQDLMEQAQFRADPPPPSARRHPPSGFAGISRRAGRKPIIAAVNGFALGGGFEICLNW